MSLQNQSETVSRTEPMAASVNETCRITALSRTTIYALLKANRLEAVKLGRRTLIKMSSVRRLLGES